MYVCVHILDYIVVNTTVDIGMSHDLPQIFMWL